MVRTTSIILGALMALVALSACATDGSPERAWLGVVLVRDDANRLLVQSVVANSPAERAGLRVADRVVSIAGETVSFVPGTLLDFAPGDRVSIGIDRGDVHEQLEVTLGGWPQGRRPPPLPVYRKHPSTPGSPAPVDPQQA